MTRVMIVDPSPQSRGSLAEAMKQVGWEVVVAGGGAEAIASAKAARPDIVLIDHDLKDMDSMAVLCAILVELGAGNVRIAMMSRMAQKDRVVKAIQAGACDYLVRAVGEETRIIKRLKAHAKRDAWPGCAGREHAGAITAQSTETPTDLVTPAGSPPSGDIPPAKAREVLKSLKPLIGKTTLLERIDKATELRALSPTVKQIVAMTVNSSVSTEELAKVIKRDQAIAIKILRVANSALYAHGDRVDTIHKAILRIGTEQIRQAVLNIAVVEHFGGATAGGRMRSDWFWEHSIGCGLLAAAITRLRGQKPEAVDAMFTAGLLHDIGRMILAEQLGEAYTRVFEWSQKLGLPLEVVEMRLLGVDHADLAERVLRAWKFPPDLFVPIALHHLSIANIRRHAPSRVEDAATIALANRLAHAMGVGTSGNDAIYDLDEFITALNLDPLAVLEIAQRLPDQAADLRLAMLTHTNEHPSDSVVDSLRQRLGDVRPLIVQTGPQATDAVRMFFDRIRPEDQTQRPNVAVLMVRNDAECAAAISRFAQDEAAAGCEGLPVLVISPTGTFTLDEHASVGRRVATLTAPIDVHRLIDTMTTLISPNAHDKGEQARAEALAA